MIYKDFKEKKLSLLGFGTMRLPQLGDGPSAPVDEAQVEQMVDYAIAHGVNYFDTAYPYHGGEAERVLGRALKKYPREQFNIATKYPGHQISKSYDPAAIFEEQLEKCGVEYFDFYLLHNVYENSIKTYTDPRWGIVDYFVEQKRLGRIRHLGFSCHGSVSCLTEFLDKYGDVMEFCQIQLNYLDWTLQDAKTKYELLTQRGIPVWVMEPVRGGKLASLSPEAEERLRSERPDDRAPAWAFRFLQGLENVHMILSGMSCMEQMRENTATFEAHDALTPTQEALLLDVAEGMKNSIPCTGCRYCCDGCPQKLDIPMLLAHYNELRFEPRINIAMSLDALPEDKRPAACLGCGKCAMICPQRIDIPSEMRAFAQMLAKLPSWEEMCRQRDAAAEKGRK